MVLLGDTRLWGGGTTWHFLRSSLQCITQRQAAALGSDWHHTGMPLAPWLGSPAHLSHLSCNLCAQGGATSTLISHWACHETQFTISQPCKSYTPGLRDFYSLQNGRSSTCTNAWPGPWTMMLKGCTSDESRKLWCCVFVSMLFLSCLHVSLLSEKLKHFTMFLAVSQALHRIQIKVGGCLVCLFIISLAAAPPKFQEARKRQNVAMFPAIQLLSFPRDLDQESVGKEGEHSFRRVK